MTTAEPRINTILMPMDGESAKTPKAMPGLRLCTRYMKLGMTSMRQPVHPNADSVSVRRNCETAVSPSDFSIENFVIGWKEGSCPTIVMSVPWSVVMSCTSSPV